MSKGQRKIDTDDMEELAAPRQVRFQKVIEQELEELAKLNGTDFPTVVRIATRIALHELKQRLGTEAKKAA